MIVAEREMERREHLIWADRPRRAARRTPLVRAAFGMVYAGFAVVWIVLAAGLQDGVFEPPDDPLAYIFPAIGLPFLAIGLWITISAFRGGGPGGAPVYALSDRRALLLAPGRPVVGVYLADIEDVTIVEQPDGAGDIVFAGRRIPADFAFRGVARVNAVATEIATARGLASAS